jgi:hypothetical protein
MVRVDWLVWSNPLALWWSFLILVSAANLAFLFFLYSRYRTNDWTRHSGALGLEPLFFLGAAYVIGCAFRSILPRADVQRICLFDTWLSSVLVGRTVATLAEMCFIIQWAIVLRALARLAHAESAANIARAIVPIVAVAEACSWYAVITTNYLGNVLENSLWTVAFVLIAIALLDLLNRYRGIVRGAIAVAALGIAGYVAFMCTIDVPMYFVRWRADLAAHREFFGLFGGLHDVATRWVVTHDVVRWYGEMTWMSLYFSAAVWMSLLLAGFGLMKHLLPRYRAGRPTPQLSRRPAVVPLSRPRHWTN